MSTVPVVVTEHGRNCTHCGHPLTITVLEFYDDPHPAPVATTEGFVDCPNECTGAIDPENHAPTTLPNHNPLRADLKWTMMPTSNEHPQVDGVSAAPGTPTSAPRFTSSLIAALGLSHASPEKREQGVAHWLRHNTPNKPLRGSLTRCEYGHLLGQ